MFKVTFSPDGNLVASAGWDNHTKIWAARDGRFLATLRGHVGPVFQVSVPALSIIFSIPISDTNCSAFSADSRLLVTCSRDTTLKVWSMSTFKLVRDLPGHQDEVYAVVRTLPFLASPKTSAKHL